MTEMEQEKRASIHADVMLRRALDLKAKDNVLIAEFMGITPNEEGVYQVSKHKGYDVENLQYHTSWDWLMPVVEKIEEDERYNIDILQYGTIISSNTKEQGYLEIVNNVADISFDNKIEHTYKAVVQFIKYYNQNK